MELKAPQEIRIGVHKYSVVFNPNLYHDFKQYGTAYHRKCLIEIEPSINNPEKMVTLIHEIIHIIKNQYSCDINEDDIDRLANGFSEFLTNSLGIDFDWSDVPDNPEAKIDWKW